MGEVANGGHIGLPRVQSTSVEEHGMRFLIENSRSSVRPAAAQKSPPSPCGIH